MNNLREPIFNKRIAVNEGEDHQDSTSSNQSHALLTKRLDQDSDRHEDQESKEHPRWSKHPRIGPRSIQITKAKSKMGSRSNPRSSLNSNFPIRDARHFKKKGFSDLESLRRTRTGSYQRRSESRCWWRRGGAAEAVTPTRRNPFPLPSLRVTARSGFGKDHSMVGSRQVR